MTRRPSRTWRARRARTAKRRWLAPAAVMTALPLTVGITWHSLLWQPQLGAGDVPDFSAYSTPAERKRHFFAWLRPIVEAENQVILDQRHRLQALLDDLSNHRNIGWLNRHWLLFMAKRYNVDTADRPRAEIIQALLRHVDMVPTSLVLVQAAKESSWGRSRFARHGDNLFGQHCFESGCGIIPKDRAPHRHHEVETFDSVRDAVASYLLNLNSHPRYTGLRAIRAELRQRGKPITGVALADGLAYYSERRDEYINEVKSMIVNNHLARSASSPQ